MLQLFLYKGLKSLPGYKAVKFKMVVNTEILLQAWRERWTPLQWLVEVKKLAGKDKKDLDDLAGYLMLFWSPNLKSKQAKYFYLDTLLSRKYSKLK